jgi:hypothetical protein
MVHLPMRQTGTRLASGAKIFRRSNESRLYIANNPLDYQANLIDSQFQLHLYKGRRFLFQTLFRGFALQPGSGRQH